MSRSDVQKQLDAAGAAEQAAAHLAASLDGADAHESMEGIQRSLQRQLTSLARSTRSLARHYAIPLGGGGDPELGSLEHSIASSLEAAAEQCAGAAESLTGAADGEQLIARVYR